jgi:glycosyltransferase involved in cell wall biosynthesis
MSFLQRELKSGTVAWFVQRTLVILVELRLPQLHLKRRWELRKIKKDHLRQVRARVKKFLASTKQPGFNALHLKTDTDNHSEVYPVVNPENIRNSHLINRYFDRILIINLKSRYDRRLKAIQELRRMGIDAEVFFADDGYSPSNLKEYYKYASKPIGGKNAHPMESLYARKMIMGPGALGYLKTFKRLLHYAIDQGWERILCFDDDIFFHHQFHDLFEKRIAGIPSDWKLLYLGATQHGWETVEKDERNIHLKDTFGNDLPYYYPKYVDGSFAIGIHSSVFGFLLKELEKMNCSFDTGALREVNFKFPGQTFVMLPNLVIADVSESDIGKNRDQHEFAQRMRWDMNQYDFPVKYDLVSVIMPAYNAEKTIEKSIRSILAQTYPNLELIVADDGSNDSTPQIVEALAREDGRVRLHRLGANKGCYCARNEAIHLAKGKFIAIQDADDFALKHRLERQLIPLCAGQAEFTVAHVFRSRCLPDELDILDQSAMVKSVLAKRQKRSKGEYGYRDQPILGLMTSVFKKELFHELGLFWENRFGADSEFAERILFNRKGPIFIDDDPSVQSYLSRMDRIEGVYKRINEVLVVSADMGAQNITGSYGQEERNDFIRTWRRRFRGEGNYQYPSL